MENETSAWITLHESLQATIEQAMTRVDIKLEHGQGLHSGVGMMAEEIERLRKALAIIYAWAKCDNTSHESRDVAMHDIQVKCEKVLNDG